MQYTQSKYHSLFRSKQIVQKLGAKKERNDEQTNKQNEETRRRKKNATRAQSKHRQLRIFNV